MIDLFVIPDYVGHLVPSGDKVFKTQAGVFKGESTQLQWIFESVQADDFFPLGVKVTYRAYSADEVKELRVVKSAKEMPEESDLIESKLSIDADSYLASENVNSFCKIIDIDVEVRPFPQAKTVNERVFPSGLS